MWVKRSVANTAAASVEETTAPRSTDCNQDRSNRAYAASPVRSAVTTTPTVLSRAAGTATSRSRRHEVASPPRRGSRPAPPPRLSARHRRRQTRSRQGHRSRAASPVRGRRRATGLPRAWRRGRRRCSPPGRHRRSAGEGPRPPARIFRHPGDAPSARTLPPHQFREELPGGLAVASSKLCQRRQRKLRRQQRDRLPLGHIPGKPAKRGVRGQGRSNYRRTVRVPLSSCDAALRGAPHHESRWTVWSNVGDAFRHPGVVWAVRIRALEAS
jgi:hypothetical protein